jgi:hypothetical protein
MKWRKFIQCIVKYRNIEEDISIETLLSKKKYDLINFDTIPIKAMNLYKNTFMKIPELRKRYIQFINIKELQKKEITNTIPVSNEDKLNLVRYFIPLVKIHSDSLNSPIL